MSIIQHNPGTPGQRFLHLSKRKLYKNRPERSLVVSKIRGSGRNCYGRITSRRKGGGHKKLYRIVDFKRDKLNIPGVISRIEYDPNRSADIALVVYRDGEKRYIPCPRNAEIGTKVVSLNSPMDNFNAGMSLPLNMMPLGIPIHCVELHPGCGAVLARSAGTHATLVAMDGKFATVKMPSGEIRLLNPKCRATIGEIGNGEHFKQSLGKAGRNRWLGRRPRVRGVAMNPVDHPMGGGEGRSSGGRHPTSPWAQLAKGLPTRKKSKPTNAMIIVRRNGRKVKKG
ncbi:MAG: 50S ribosomal protein L2 [Puniceicoccales bacterium]|jgi:large subunit ribosomal protein L2|nr:50S ribosomal protein L2 [Puniceicoccales bacterium]